jgi:nucleoside-diphosphate-sugar epimerase
MAERKAMVIGTTGVVGSAVAEALLDGGWHVGGVARRTDVPAGEALAAKGATLRAFDVTRDDPADLPDADVLFLEIWDPTDEALIWPVNFYGVGRVVERYAGTADIVNGCTINVYGDSPHAPGEDAPCRPTSEYGRSRYAQERLIDYFCHRSGSKGIHVRYAHSNSAARGVVRRFAEKIIRGESLGPDPDARIQVIALEDFVRVTLGGLDHLASPPAVVNCCHPRVWTRRELADEIQERLGSGEVRFDRETGGEENSAYADVNRMLEWFGPPRVPLDTLLSRVVDAVLHEA